ncbi:PC4-domain-containing protein [Aspergillus ellipticus CBS 707.79]|uniref:PC4-domain-containing protein n=1 Tax=Aspergillus ellipticus CBS 707.79 TaxID=1448320 RepID=A0A319F075_9EURO|nr:PC4-domain-containing protein [Aspergillus ellipticus CBS 707.79]
MSQSFRAPDAENENIVDYDQPLSKRTKAYLPKDSSGSGLAKTNTNMGKLDSNGDHYWELSKMRRLTVSSFRGKTMVNIREYYEKDGQQLPGKKGISLPVDQFSSLVILLPEIEATLRKIGGSIPRPRYISKSGKTVDEEEEEEEEEDDDDGTGNLSDSRKNIEATSEDDSDGQA